MSAPVIVSAGFDRFGSHHLRFLHEASRHGAVHVLLWSDEAVESVTGAVPQFPLPERQYLLQAVRFVERITVTTAGFEPDSLPDAILKSHRPGSWIVDEAVHNERKRSFSAGRGLQYRVLGSRDLDGFPPVESRRRDPPVKSRAKALVTGCFDWFHSGHVRFFEEAAGYGELYVVVGHDANLRLLKGEGHPLFPQEERCYMIQAVRYVAQALISTGHGWMDAEPEIDRIKPDLYIVNEDGDKPEKRSFCEERGIEYVVLKREPKKGLAQRMSTNLRGF